MNKLAHRDIVIELNNPNKEYVILGKTKDQKNNEEILVLNEQDNTIEFLNENNLKKISQFDDEEVYFCPPIFEDLSLLDDVEIKSLDMMGKIIAINPCIIPLNESCNYLILLTTGEIIQSSREQIKLIER